jgi:prepilin-type processing-associated H-X9-DG protein
VVHGAAPRVSNDQPGTGVFAASRGLRLDQIHDGAAQTFALGERATQTASRGAGIWMRSTNAARNGPDATAVAGICHETARLNDPLHPAAFGSSHASGAHFLFADGKVRFIHEMIDPALYASLADRGDPTR